MKTATGFVSRVYQRLLAPVVASVTQPATDEKEIPQKHTRLQIRIAVSAFFFCQGISFASWASRIPDIKYNLQLTDAALGSLLLLLPAGQLSAMPFSGKLVTHFGSKKIMRIFLVLYVLALTNIGYASSAWQLGLGLYLFGVFGNMANISVNTQAIGAEKMYGRTIMTSFHGTWSAAGLTGALIGMLMMSLGVTPHVHFWIVAGFVICTVMIAQNYLAPGRSASATAVKRRFFSLPNKALAQLGIIGFCSMASEGAMFDWSGVYFKQVVHAPNSFVLLGYLGFMATMATGRFLGGNLLARYGRKKVLRFSGIMISIGLLISVLFPYLATASLGFIIVGLGVSSIVPMVYSSAGKIPHVSPGIALASVSSISYLGFLMGPPLIGYIAELASLRWSFAVIALAGFTIALLVSKLKVLND